MSDLVSPCPFASLERLAMLTPVTPNPITTSTTIKTHGSESRAMAGQNQAEAQAAPPVSTHNAGIGLDAGTILANVNAEAATAGNRTILQTLALAVAAQLNIVRRNDETMDAFFLRIAATIDAMMPEEQAATAARAGLALLKVSLPDLSAALKQPDSALAARLSAMAEAPMATPQKTAAAVATTTYLQEAANNSRAAETLAMVNQLRGNPDGSGLFSSTAPEAGQRQPTDARSLQMQLASLFEPGIAETRMEIAGREEIATALLLRTDGAANETSTASLPQEQVAAAGADETPQAPADLSDPPAAAQSRQLDAAPDVDQPLASSKLLDAKQAGVEARLAGGMSADAEVSEAGTNATSSETADAATAEKPTSTPAPPRPEPRMIGLPLSQSSNSPSLAMRIRAIAQELAPNKTPIEDDRVQRSDAGQHVQTLLVLKGIAEVIMPMPARADEATVELPHGPALRDEAVEKAALATADLPDDGAAPDAAVSSAQASRKDPADGRHVLPPSLPDAEDTAEATKVRHPAPADAQAMAKAPEAQPGTALLRAGLDAVPFAYSALQPAKDQFKAKAAPEGDRQDEEDDTGEGEQREDPEARRERLARKAVDDLLRPEAGKDPEVKITRDSSQADRAYALYQRMGGF